MPSGLLARTSARGLLAAGACATLGLGLLHTARRRARAAGWWRLGAVQVVCALREGRVTPSELVECAAARIGDADGDINAVVTLCLERARARARALEAAPGGAPGPLFGLPVLVKDNQPVAGVRCTAGAPRFAGRVAEADHEVVRAVEAAGGVVLGLTNMPEHAAGSHTFNPVFGATANPHERSRSAGGSSGGAAAALASGQAWLATGSDLGGSLRNPAAFCGVVGIRPSPGRVATSPLEPGAWRGHWGLGVHAVNGPLGRSVADAALLLDALTAAAAPEREWLMDNWAPDACAELPPPPAGGYVGRALSPDAHRPASVAWSADLGGLLKGVHPEVAGAVERAAKLLAAAAADARLVHASPRGLNRAEAIFRLLRGSRQLDSIGGGPGGYAAWKDEWADQAKPELVWELAAAARPEVAAQLGPAEHARQELEGHFVRFVENFEVLVCPVSPMPAFDGALRYPSQPPAGSAGSASWAGGGGGGGAAAEPAPEMRDYIGWMLPCSVVSLAGLPAMSVPVGFSTGGLPIGVQLVGRPGGEADLIACAALLERAVAASGTYARDGATLDATAPVDAGAGEPRGPHEGEWDGPRTADEARAHHGRWGRPAPRR